MMSPLGLSDIAVTLGGQLVDGAAGDSVCAGVCTDTRRLQPGDLFVALSGEHFDGNRFVGQAADGGAVAAVVSSTAPQKIPYIVVEDTRLALGLIANMNRHQFSGPVVGLTGSAGKTTCKEMIASVLAECGSVLSTRDNNNNEVGVPLTLLEISAEHDYAVIEMGASRLGDIRYLAGFAQADIALVTNAMPAHMASFGSVETIAKTKGEIFECLAADGTAIINFDDHFCGQWQTQAAGRKIIGFSKTSAEADVYTRDIQLHNTGETGFTLCTPVGEIDISLSLLGEHNINNALAAAAAAIAAGANLQQISAGLSKVTAVKGRLKPIAMDGLTVIDDSYNASPDAVKAAIDVLNAFPMRRCLLLGTMGELGADAEAQHREVADYARAKGIEQLITVGEFAPVMAQVFGAGASSFEQLDELLVAIAEHICADVVLVKGSRFMHMERAVENLSQLSAEQLSKARLAGGQTSDKPGGGS